jgi:hypothetical protein
MTRCGARKESMRPTNRYQAIIEALCQADGLALPVAELLFAAPRKWRFDFGWISARVALEVQGGLFSGGRHVNGARLLGEHDKVNAAAALGWRVCYCTPRTLATVWPTVKAAIERS